ncbi:hypothetical protein ABZ876_31315 [Streptomyces sp. NPDC046931]|uniref:hypothetical protein n=1 Tax=Streptomyces sp. NPDC046931 TaxID=3154806 RepID=UPI0033FB5080
MTDAMAQAMVDMFDAEASTTPSRTAELRSRASLRKRSSGHQYPEEEVRGDRPC